MSIDKNLIYFAGYFLLSTIITWLFIIKCPLYISQAQMLLSTSIAGGKWGIQIIVGWLNLKEKTPIFLHQIGRVCFVGSCLLLPYVLLASFGISNAPKFFFYSLVLAVFVMIVMYYFAVKRANVSLIWWFGWLICLLAAITSQLTFVFKVL